MNLTPEFVFKHGGAVKSPQRHRTLDRPFPHAQKIFQFERKSANQGRNQQMAGTPQSQAGRAV